eukprot:UN13982
MEAVEIFHTTAIWSPSSLPYVEYVKVKSVKVKPGANTHNGCRIDGELCRVKGQVVCSMLPEQCNR